jgi:hypothetical protein
VKDLQFLLAAYLEPLKKEHFWNYADLEQLYKNVKEIFIFQTKFLRILEESLESDPGFCSHTSLAQFKVSRPFKGQKISEAKLHCSHFLPKRTKILS